MARFRVLLDTNILLRGLVNSRSVSGKVLDACDRRIAVPVLSGPVLKEYRSILTDPRVVARYPELTPRKVEMYLARIRYVGDLIRSPSDRFDFSRDRKDAKLIELALAARATHLVTHDQDLLDLPHGHDDASRRLRQRLPSLQIVKPEVFLRAIEMGSSS